MNELTSFERELTENIVSNKSVLFLGQAYLKWVNYSLTDLIPVVCDTLSKRHSDFGNCTDFSSFCRALTDSGVTRDILLRTVHKASESIPINDEIRMILTAPWRAIFTTAIDDVVTRALAGNSRLVRFVYDTNLQLINVRDPNNLYVFRLHGSVDQLESNRVPIFESELPFPRKRRIQQMLDQLVEVAGFDDANVVIGGLDPSVDDFVLSELIPRLAEIRSKVKSFWSDFEDSDRLPSSIRKLVDSGDVLTSAIELPKLLKPFKDELKCELRSVERSINIHDGKTIEIDEALWRRLRENGIYVISNEDRKSNRYPDSIRYQKYREFLRGENEFDWRAHVSGFVFERPVVNDLFKSRNFRQEFPTGRSKNNRVFTVSGPAGSGKSVTMKEIAWRAATKNFPVLIIPKSCPRPDFQLIDLFCHEVQQKGRKKNEQRGAEANTRVLVIWDSHTFDAEQYLRLANFLKSTGRSAHVVGSTYHPSKVEGIRDFSIPTHLNTSNEKIEFQGYLTAIIDNTILNGLDIFRFLEATGKDFLHALYDYLPEVRDPLQASINLQYRTYEETISDKFNAAMKDTSNEWKDFAPLVFIPSQFDCWPNIELVLDAMGFEYRIKWLRVGREKLIVKDFLFLDSEHGIQRLRARSAWIARRSLFSYSRGDQVKMIARLARTVRPKNELEVDFLQRLFSRLRSSIDSRNSDDRLFRGHEIELANVLKELRDSRGFNDPILMHVEGLLRNAYVANGTKKLGDTFTGIEPEHGSRDENVDQLYRDVETQHELSVQVLQKALDVLDQANGYSFSLRTERQNIANSIAASYRDMVRIRYSFLQARPGDEEEIRRHIKREASLVDYYCDQAGKGPNLSHYEIDVRLGNLLNRYRYDEKLTENERIELAGRMLHELDRWSIDFSDEDTNTELLGMRRIEVTSAIGEFDAADEAIEELRREGNLWGYFLKARNCAYKYDEKTRDSRPNSKHALSEAKKLLDTLQPFELSADKLCLGLYFRIIWDMAVPEYRIGRQLLNSRDITTKLSTEKWTEIKDVLQKLVNLETTNTGRTVFYKFLLGWALFQLGETKDSLQSFSEIRDIRFYSPLRVASLVRISDERGDYRRFTGEVRDVDPNRQKGSIYCPSLGIYLPFNKDEFRGAQIGERLNFEIVLNYQGAAAHKPKTKESR